jgi:quercetin dioxygenase-like cupin family protein
MESKIAKASSVEVLNVLGIPHAVLVERNDNPSGYELLEITGAPDVGVPMHVNKKEDETFYVAEGEVVFTLDNREFSAFAGTAVNLFRGVPHAFRIIAPNCRIALTISPGNLLPMMRELASLSPGAPDMSEITAICSKFDVRFL